MKTIEEEIRRYATDVVGSPRGPIPSEPRRDDMQGRGPWLIAALCLVLLVGVGAAIALRQGNTSKAPASETPSTQTPSTALRPRDLVGRPAPELSGTTFDGSTVTLSSMRGSWVVVDISATWCVPCRLQVPQLVALSQARPTVKVLTIAYDDDLSQMSSMYTSAGATWPVITVSNEALIALRATGIPTSYVVSPDGAITTIFEGATLQQLEASTGDPSPSATTTPGLATVPVAEVGSGGGTACNADGFCAKVSGEAPDVKFQLLWQSNPIGSYETDACSLESMNNGGVSIAGGVTDDAGVTTYGVWTGIASSTVETVQLPGVEIEQLKFSYQGQTIRAFYAYSETNITDALGKAFTPTNIGGTTSQPTADPTSTQLPACSGRSSRPPLGASR